METEKVLTFTVSQRMLAQSVGSGSLPVLATPTLCALFEKAAAALAQARLPQEQSTVGTALDIQHTAPTPLGATVQLRVVLTAQQGRQFSFTAEAKDPCGPCFSGTHSRVAVLSDRFLEKAQARGTEKR